MHRITIFTKIKVTIRKKNTKKSKMIPFGSTQLWAREHLFFIKIMSVLFHFYFNWIPGFLW